MDTSPCLGVMAAEAVSPAGKQSGANNRAASPGTGADRAVQLTPFAKRLPKPLRSGNLQVDSTRLIEHEATQKVISLLQAHPSQSLLSLASLQTNLRCQASSDDYWGSDVKNLMKLPSHWMSQWLVDASKGDLVQKDMEKIVEVDPQAPATMFHFATQTKPGHKLPDLCLEKQVCCRVFFQRARLLSHRLTGWKAKALNKDGSLNWGAGGCFTLEFDEGRAVAIHHVSGDSATIPNHVHITKDFSLVDNWSDSCAAVKLHPSVYLCKDLFDAKAGPHKHELSGMQAPELNQLAEVVHAELAEARTKVVADTLDENPEFLKEASKKRHSSATAKAREARKVATQKKLKARTVDLNSL